MKPAELFGTAMLLLLFGTLVPTYAQPSQRGQEGTPPPLWKKKPQGNPETGSQGNPGMPGPQQHGQGQQNSGPQPPPSQASRPMSKPYRQQQIPSPSGEERRGRDNQHQAVWQEHRARNWQSEHHDWQSRGGYNGYRIPNDRYRRNFGPGHVFRIHEYPVGMVGGFINFQYGGFGFSVMDPVPESWSDDWYRSDDVYIDYWEGGYYMHNRRHPEDRIAVSVDIR